MNCCIVKYIHLKDTVLHHHNHPSTLGTTIQDFEFKRELICHDSYDSMVQAVSDQCPRGFSCVHPITLHHEVLWNAGLVANTQGETAVDHLFRPIDSSDYIAVKWNKTTDATSSSSLAKAADPMLSVCVRIHAQEVILS